MDWNPLMSRQPKTNSRFLQNIPIKSKIFWLFLASNFLAVMVVSGLVVVDQYRQSKKNLEDGLLVQANIVSDNVISAVVFNDAHTAQEILFALHGSPNVRQAAI